MFSDYTGNNSITNPSNSPLKRSSLACIKALLTALRFTNRDRCASDLYDPAGVSIGGSTTQNPSVNQNNVQQE